MSKTFRHVMHASRIALKDDNLGMYYSRYDDEGTRRVRALRQRSAMRAARAFTHDELLAYCREHDLAAAMPR
jgi:hypothetical protein